MSNANLTYEEYEVDIYADIERNLRYSDFVSLLRELIQNSDDSSTDGRDVEVEVYFLKDKLVLKNNTAFTENDWKKIKVIGSRNKEGDSSKTGRFGIGFTSVFEICDVLKIHSRNVSKIVDLNLLNTGKTWGQYPPEDTRYHNEDFSEFEFFWRTEESEASRQIGAEAITNEKINTYIDETLNNIQNDIHFLNHINKLNIYKDETLIQRIRIQKESLSLSDKIYKDTKTICVDGTKTRMVIYHKKLDEYFTKEFDNGTARRKPLLLSVALNCSNIQNGRVFCTLPTELTTGFSFDINCDFQPDQSRKRLIFNKDDAKGRYNTKILNFVPDLLYEIMDDLKEEISVELFYKTLSTSDDSQIRSFNLHSLFINKVKENDCKIINLNKKWYSISKVKILRHQEHIIRFLHKINYPIIPEKHATFYKFFNEVGVKDFELKDFIQIIEEKIPQKILLKESIIESETELDSIFRYLQNTLNKRLDDRLKMRVKGLNIFLNKKYTLCNILNHPMFFVPDELNTIKDDLPIERINNDFNTKFKYFLSDLGINNFSPQDLKLLILKDFTKCNLPIELSHAVPYLNSKTKLKEVIIYLREDISLLQNREVKNKDFTPTFINKRLISPQEKKASEEKEEQRKKDSWMLPLVLSRDNKLYPISNRMVYDLKSKYKEEFASRYGLKSIDEEIKTLFEDCGLIFPLSIGNIIDHFEKYNHRNDVFNDSDLVLMYHLLSEEKYKLFQNERLVSRIKKLRIFRNTRGNSCSLDNNGKSMMLQGNYHIPAVIPINNILDESLISKSFDLSNFKNDVLKSVFKLQEINFEYYIKQCCKDIFINDSIKIEEKLEFVNQLNEKFFDLEKKPIYSDLKPVLMNSNLIFCNDGYFHSPSSDHIYFKSEELDELFGQNYLYPHPSLGDIKRYVYFFKQMGVKEKATSNQIVSHIIDLRSNINIKINVELIKRLSRIFVYINKLAADRTIDELSPFRRLAEVEWLPALGNEITLYKPSSLYLQNTKPFLSESNNILYLSIDSVNKNLVSILNLNDVTKISTKQIIENLKVLSNKKKIISNHSRIYSKLNERVSGDSIYINDMKSFPSIYVAFKNEKPQYYYPSEVFTDNLFDIYDDYVGYLPHEFTANHKKLVDSLGILNRPDSTSLVSILKKIESRYHQLNYNIGDESDRKILQNCLKELNKIADSVDESSLSKLKSMHILCNQKNKLITPNDAILEDNVNLSNEFRELLGERYIKYAPDIEELIYQLDLKKLSSLVHKEMLSKPNFSDLKIDTDITQKIRFLNELFPRIKVQIGDRIDKKEWKEIDSNIEVFHFDKLNISKYIVVDGQIYCPSNMNDIDCYIESDKKVLKIIYIKSLKENTLLSISSELIKEIHPNTEISLKSVVFELLKKDSFEKMNEYLTSIGYPDIGETKDTTLHSNKQIEDYTYSDSNQDLDFERDNYDIDASIENDSILKNKEKSCLTDNSSIQKTEVEHGIGEITSCNTDLHSSQSIRTPSKNQFNKNDDVNEDFDSPHKRGRTTSPTKEMDFNEEIGEQYAQRNHPTNQENHEKYLIDEKLDPMSLEDEKRFNDTVIFEIENEIENIREDNIKRTYTSQLRKIKENTVSKLEVKDFYKGKCQICGFNFRKKDGSMYCITVSLLEKRNGGIRHPANYLCLCPNHAALLKYSYVAGLDKKSLVNIKNNKIKFNTNDSEYEINYHPMHFRMLKELLKRGRHN